MFLESTFCIEEWESVCVCWTTYRLLSTSIKLLGSIPSSDVPGLIVIYLRVTCDNDTWLHPGNEQLLTFSCVDILCPLVKCPLLEAWVYETSCVCVVGVVRWLTSTTTAVHRWLVSVWSDVTFQLWSFVSISTYQVLLMFIGNFRWNTVFHVKW